MALILFFIAYVFLRKGGTGGNYTASSMKPALKAVMQKYGRNTANTVEMMFRLETANFTSEQYRKTGTAGMQSGNWGEGVPKATVVMKDNATGQPVKFIKWNPKAAALFMAEYIKRHDGKFANWNSILPDRQIVYIGRVMAMPHSITDSIQTSSK